MKSQTAAEIFCLIVQIEFFIANKGKKKIKRHFSLCIGLKCIEMSSGLPVSHTSDLCMLSSDGSLRRPTCNMLNCQVRITFVFDIRGITVWNELDS